MLQPEAQCVLAQLINRRLIFSSQKVFRSGLAILRQMKLLYIIFIIGAIVIVASSPCFCQAIAFSQTQEKHVHSQKVGLSETNAIMINWSDRNDYEVSANVREVPSTEDGIGIEADVIAKRGNDTSHNFTLSFVVECMPNKRTFRNLNLDPKEIEAGSEFTIQRKNATLVYFWKGNSLKEEDALLRLLPAAIDSKSSQQDSTPEMLWAIYYPDNHTTLTVIAPADKWTDSDFREMLESIEITMPPSSSVLSDSYQPAPSWERWRCRWPSPWDYRCSWLSCL